MIGVEFGSTLTQLIKVPVRITVWNAELSGMEPDRLTLCEQNLTNKHQRRLPVPMGAVFVAGV